MKNQQAILKEKIGKMPVLSSEKVKKLPFLWRIPVSYVMLSQELVLEYKKELDEKLQALDQSCEHQSNFTQITEEQLWQKRNKAYNYLM